MASASRSSIGALAAMAAVSIWSSEQVRSSSQSAFALLDQPSAVQTGDAPA